MSKPLPREILIQRSRIAILDDEVPEILADLRRYGLSVDHIPSTEDAAFAKLETAFYDLLLLDFGGVGAKFGPDQGLDVLRHLKRINPGLCILAYTARTFDASKADFFRSDGVLLKDAGIRETLEQIEGHLERVLTLTHQWRSLCQVIGAVPDSEETRSLERKLSKALLSGKGAKERALAIIKPLGAAAGPVLLEKTIEKMIEFVGQFASKVGS